MQHIILIEDRPSRQENLLKSHISLDAYPILNNVCGGPKCDELKSKIEKHMWEFLDGYETIAIHRSALSSQARNALMNYCKNKQKKLILFSGGVSSPNLQEEKNFKLLTINDKLFYSENLKHFLESGGNELMYLAFGKDWKINRLITLHEKLTLLIHHNLDTTTDWYELNYSLELDSSEVQDYFSSIQNKEEITRSELEAILNQLYQNILSFI